MTTRSGEGHGGLTGKRALLLAVAGLLSAAAALAIGILLFGDFGSTEGRILGTTAALAGYGLLALPAAMLQDRGRLPLLAGAVAALAAAGAALLLAVIWTGEPPESLGKTIGTVNAWLAAGVQTAALALRRREGDPPSVRRLFVASIVLVSVLAALFTTLMWADVDSAGFGRVFGALLVLDVLLVALQPLLARARPALTPHRLRVVVAGGAPVELELDAPDLASAAAQAVRVAERRGLQVERLEVERPPLA